jgi:hypothetical protein
MPNSLCVPSFVPSEAQHSSFCSVTEVNEEQNAFRWHSGLHAAPL